MLNRQFRDDSIAEYKKSESEYEAAKISVMDESEKLFGKRKYLKLVIEGNWNAIHRLKNQPRVMQLEVQKIEQGFKTYDTFLMEVETAIAANQELQDALKSAVNGLSNVNIRTIAAAIATTFGIASRGTMSGSVAAGASIAWLGGSVFSGGSVAIGSGLIGLTGPIGWGIVFATGLLQNGKNKKMGREAREKATALKKERVALKQNEAEIKELIDLTNQHYDGLQRLLNEVKPKLNTYGWDMEKIQQDQDLLKRLAVWMNSLESATQLLNKKVGKSK
ncbi:hypothetical protein ACNOIU_03115 [Exiguobacterium mexicanum]|uniref:Uncharacterized protein n=1 Tax=Exiguobacterium mexicanum TaxID=340146 RepID=A0ABT7MMG8_9BACL|nr:hypothetical protein [Exiguobacterium mexicanum]MDL5376375.1 hypothetical protein [Exiguobacterium mexicanum]